MNEIFSVRASARNKAYPYAYFIDVIDDRKKILILFSNPHPDIAAIKESLETHDQYEVYVKWVSDSNKQSGYSS